MLDCGSDGYSSSADCVGLTSTSGSRLYENRLHISSSAVMFAYIIVTVSLHKTLTATRRNEYSSLLHVQLITIYEVIAFP